MTGPTPGVSDPGARPATAASDSTRSTDRFWYTLGAVIDSLVLIVLAYVSLTRTDPLERQAESMKQVQADMNQAFSSLRGERFASLRPVDEDISRHISRGYSGDARMLILRQREITAADLAKIPALGEGLEISLAESRFPAAALGALKGLSAKKLDFEGSSLDDEGLAELIQLGHLEIISLAGTEITDRGLAYLARIPGLTRVSLKKTMVTDQGVAELGRIRTLSRLDLSETSVTGAGLGELPEALKLEELNLADSQVDDETLPAVLQLHVENLDLENTRISDVGLDRITQCNARYLKLEGSRVTQQGAESLQSRLSGVFVLNVGPPDPAELEMERIRGQVEGLRNSIPRPVIPIPNIPGRR